MLVATIVCAKMKWTWQQYREQPTYFIESLIHMFAAEADAQRKANKNN